MTFYWWMHWFWITSWIMVLFTHIPCECVLTTTSLHSIPTDSPSTLLIRTNQTQSRENESIAQTPPITLSRSVDQKNFTSRNVVKQNDSTFLQVTEKVNSTKKQSKEYKMQSVINQANSTENDATALWTNATSNAENITGGVPTEDQIDKLVVDEVDKVLPDPSGAHLSAAGITGITLGCIVCVAIICGVSFFLYHNHGFNKPQVLNDRCSNPDSSGYIDDASVRDNSEEMYSLDNDSFLNSLEAMTIQNYWTDTVKHTKL